MADLAELGAPYMQGLQIGAQLGHTIAQNQIERERQRRIMEQAQIANGIRQREQAIADAEAARKAAVFQQQADFANFVQGNPNATPEEITSRMPQSELPRALERQQSDAEREQRLQMTQQAYNERNQARIDAKAAEQDARIAAAEKAAQKAQEAAMARVQAVQSGITGRAEAKAAKKAETFPDGSPADLLDKLLTAKEAGATGTGTVSASGFEEKAPHFWNSAEPIDDLIRKYSEKVPAATKRKIEAKHAEESDQPDAGEPSAIPLPTGESDQAPETAPAKLDIQAEREKAINAIKRGAPADAVKKLFKQKTGEDLSFSIK